MCQRVPAGEWSEVETFLLFFLTSKPSLYSSSLWLNQSGQLTLPSSPLSSMPGTVRGTQQALRTISWMHDSSSCFSFSLPPCPWQTLGEPWDQTTCTSELMKHTQRVPQNAAHLVPPHRLIRKETEAQGEEVSCLRRTVRDSVTVWSRSRDIHVRGSPMVCCPVSFFLT